MNFSESEKYLLSLGNEVETMKLGLGNIRKLLAELGEPHTKFFKVQVAGTNGKGSVCAFLGSICQQTGIKTGVYTSPHLVSMIERIVIDGKSISEDAFADLASRVRAASESLVSKGGLEYLPTFFEQITAVALLAFAESGVKVAILETGLGGRFDAVTAANAEIAVITPISIDHEEYLGDTIEKIAAEKAAIINKASRGVVIARQDKQVMNVLRKHCSEVGIELLFVDMQREELERHGWYLNSALQNGMAVLDPNGDRSLPFELGLKGRHQLENAQTAASAALLLSRDHDFGISTDNIINGLRAAQHPGRLEYFGQFLFDGAHNSAGASALRSYLDEFEFRPLTIIFGAMKDKDIEAIAEKIFPKAKKLIFTKPANSRALDPDKLMELARKRYPEIKAYVTTNSSDALAIANESITKDGLILVTGSLYLVGEIKKLLNNQSIDP